MDAVSSTSFHDSVTLPLANTETHLNSGGGKTGTLQPWTEREKPLSFAVTTSGYAEVLRIITKETRKGNIWINRLLI